MSVEQKIKELLEASTIVTGQEATANVQKDTSKAGIAATKGDSSMPMQGSSQVPEVDELDEPIPGQQASARVQKDNTLPTQKGDAASVKTQANESVENIDEISKETLSNYINKASDDVYAKGKRIGNNQAKPGFGEDPETKETRQKTYKRLDNISKAVKKLTKEDIDNIFGETLTEEQQNHASEIFEAAVIARVNEEMIDIQEQLEESFEVSLQEQKDVMVEKIDSFLNYVVEQWIEENKLEVQQGIKQDVTENFIAGMKKLFEESYIDIPEDKVDLVSELQEKVDSLTDMLNEEISKSAEMMKTINESRKQTIFESVAKDLVLTDKEKFEKLVEGIEFTNEELYEEKLKMIKATHFKLTENVNSEIDTGSDIIMNDDRMSRYAQVISKSVKK